MRDPAAIQVRALRDYERWLGTASEGATIWEAPGVTAAIVPASPQRSIVNSVAYESSAQLAAAYDELARAYEEAGVAAWTVWTPEGDPEAIELLTGAGHVLDGQPTAMTLGLGGFDPPDPGDLDWDSDGSFAELGVVNDAAYGMDPATGYALALASPPEDLDMWVYRARRGGEVASTLATIDHDEDLGIYFVATAPTHAGHGLAGRLLARALLEGAERGLRTSSLQSSQHGRPVYERLGYEANFALHLYERRR